jgi:hypothetical protein
LSLTAAFRRAAVSISSFIGERISLGLQRLPGISLGAIVRIRYSRIHTFFEKKPRETTAVLFVNYR